MHVATEYLSGFSQGLGLLLLLSALPLALVLAPWAALRADPSRVHLVAGGAVACLLLWMLNIRIVDGLVLHLLAITTLTLVAGWSLALIAGSAALIAARLFMGLDWAGYPVAWLFTVLIPSTLTMLLVRLLYRPGLRNPFFYMLGAGFIGGALAVLVDALLVAGLLPAAFADSMEAGQLWALLLLMMFSEGFINGLCISAIAVFFPHWLKTFDERFYLDDDKPDR